MFFAGTELLNSISGAAKSMNWVSSFQFQLECYQYLIYVWYGNTRIFLNICQLLLLKGFDLFFFIILFIYFLILFN